jgi:serine protease Do
MKLSIAVLASTLAFSGWGQTPAFNWANPQSFLGVGLAEVDSGKAQELKLPGVYGAVVTLVYEKSPAEKAGFKANDVVIEFNGQRVEGQAQLRRLIQETPIGRDTKVSVVRDGKNLILTVALGRRQDYAPAPAIEFPPIAAGRLLDMPRVGVTFLESSTLGVEAEKIDGQLAEFFGTKGGILVRKVRPDSAAASAGLRAGDVIVKVDGKSIESPIDLATSVKLRDKDSVALTVIRERKESVITVTWPEGRPVRAIRKSYEPAAEELSDQQ